MAIVTESFYIPSKVDGLQLSVMTMAPDCAPIGIVQISHGMCEHKERYIPVMEFLASKGFACIIHDHRGHEAVYNLKKIWVIAIRAEKKD